MTNTYVDVIREERGGFDFSLVGRNSALAAAMGRKFQTAKSGTTICGLITGDSVIIGTDTRATNGPIIADKNCEKIHRLADNIFCGGAGTAADLEHTTAMIESQLELFRLNTGGKQVRVQTAVRRLSQHLYKYQGHVGCALILGGFDVNGPQLLQIYPHGSTDCLPFTAMGSGSLCAMAFLEANYRDNLTTQEGCELVRQAIRSGVFNDLGSGGNVDIVVVKKEGKALKTRPFDRPTPRVFTREFAGFPIGTTPLLS